MIAVDTSTWIGFLQGDRGEDTELLDRALQDRQVFMVPVVLTEILSDPKLPAEVAQILLELPLMEIQPGYWQRAGDLRAKVLAKAPQGPSRRCTDRRKLYRPWNSSPHARPGFPRLCGCGWS